jgi:hypothetical protein
MRLAMLIGLGLASLLAPCGGGTSRSLPASPAEPGPVAVAPKSAFASPDSEAARRGAEAQLALLRAIPGTVLEHISRGGRPDESGAVGHNRGGWTGAQYQRSAALYFMWAVSHDRRDAAEDAWRAVDLAFSHQEPNGAFASRKESGAPSALKDVYSDTAFWLGQLDQAMVVARSSPLAEVFRGRLDALAPKLRPSASLIARGADVLAAREATATNRYFIDALAYGLSGLLLGDHDLVSTGARFVDLGLAKQATDGSFEESGGADTSYNCVSILMLQVYDLYFPDARYDAALTRAVAWELGHVQPSGEIDTSGNSRTGLGQERYFGEAKKVNYPEAVLALFYVGTSRNDRDILDAAGRIHAYSLRAQR